MQDLSCYKKMDLPFLILLLILCTFGLIMMFSSSISISYAQNGDDATAIIAKQFSIFGLALIISILVARFIRLDFFKRSWFRQGLYLFVTFLLLLVAVRGKTVNGARRWLDLGFVTFQPSEAAKIGAVLWIALELEQKKKKLAQREGQWKDAVQKFWRQGWELLTFPVCKMLVWWGLIVIQPHFSAAIIFAALVLAMFLFAGLKKSVWIAGIIELAIIFLVVFLVALLVIPLFTGMDNSEFINKRFAHVFRRIDTYQNPAEASSDSIRQIRQAQIALGTGGFTGVGIGRSVQKMNWLPEAHNDYILAIIGEELGFLGTSAILLLFVFFMLRGFAIALKAKSRIGLMIASGYTFFLTLQAMINFAVAADLLPASGISLPFFSSGGTANAFFAIAAGMILLVSKWDQKADEKITQILEKKLTDNVTVVRDNRFTREKTGTGG